MEFFTRSELLLHPILCPYRGNNTNVICLCYIADAPNGAEYKLTYEHLYNHHQILSDTTDLTHLTYVSAIP